MRTHRLIIISFLLVTATFVLAAAACAEPPAPKYTEDKELSALYLRYGSEAFSRARYEDAKYYFQKAVQADPGSSKAWNYYDLASFYSVGEQMKTQGKYVFRPTTPSAPVELSTSAPAAGESKTSAPPAQAAPEKPKPKVQFKIGDDEGC